MNPAGQQNHPDRMQYRTPGVHAVAHWTIGQDPIKLTSLIIRQRNLIHISLRANIEANNAPHQEYSG